MSQLEDGQGVERQLSQTISVPCARNFNMQIADTYYGKVLVSHAYAWTACQNISSNTSSPRKPGPQGLSIYHNDYASFKTEHNSTYCKPGFMLYKEACAVCSKSFVYFKVRGNKKTVQTKYHGHCPPLSRLYETLQVCCLQTMLCLEHCIWCLHWGKEGSSCKGITGLLTNVVLLN